MRSIIRHFIYTAAAMYFLQSYARPFEYGSDQLKTFLVVAFAITLIVYFTRPLLKIVSFPVGGMIFTLLLVTVVGVGFYALQSLIPDFAIKAFYLPEIEFFGIIFGGAELSGLKALGFVSAAVSVFIRFIGWIMG